MDDVNESVQRGGTIAEPLRQSHVFPTMVAHMVGVGEETGNLDGMLSKVADFYEDEVAAVIKALTSILEPVMIILVGGDRRVHRDLDVPAAVPGLRQHPLDARAVLRHVCARERGRRCPVGRAPAERFAGKPRPARLSASKEPHATGR